MRLEDFLLLGAFLFVIGLMIMITKRNVIMILMGIELMLNAANVNLVAFAQYDPELRGQLFSLFVIMIAAAEAAIALAIVLQVVRAFRSSDIDEFSKLKG